MAEELPYIPTYANKIYWLGKPDDRGHIKSISGSWTLPRRGMVMAEYIAKKLLKMFVTVPGVFTLRRVFQD